MRVTKNEYELGKITFSIRQTTRFILCRAAFAGGVAHGNLHKMGLKFAGFIKISALEAIPIGTPSL